MSVTEAEVKCRAAELSRLFWVERATDEREALAKRVTQLNQFVGTEAFALLAPADRLDLSEQLFAMEQYLDALTRRLNRHKGEASAQMTLGV